jgi:hypothetical protein
MSLADVLLPEGGIQIYIRQMLIQVLQEEWERIPQQTIRKLVQSLRRRCVACVRARGGHTCY